MTFLMSTWLINIPNKACSWQFNSSLYFLFFLFKQINATFNLLSILVKQLSANNQACYFCRNTSEIYPQDFHSSVKLFRHIFKPVSSTRAGTVIICLPINCPIPSVTISMFAKCWELPSRFTKFLLDWILFTTLIFLNFFSPTSSASMMPKKQLIFSWASLIPTIYFPLTCISSFNQSINLPIDKSYCCWFVAHCS